MKDVIKTHTSHKTRKPNSLSFTNERDEIATVLNKRKNSKQRTQTISDYVKPIR